MSNRPASLILFVLKTCSFELGSKSRVLSAKRVTDSTKANSSIMRGNGFTLIEVLLALLIVTIAFTALIKSTSQSIVGTAHVKDKAIAEMIAMQGVAMIQLGLLIVPPNQEITQVTTMLGQRWYWRVKLAPTPMKQVAQITITTSKNQSGPFGNALIAFRYAP